MSAAPGKRVISGKTGSKVATPTPAHLLSVSYAVPRTGLPAPASFRRWVEAALRGARRRRPAEVAIRIVDAAEGRALNRDYRGKDYATNVLTFEYGVDPQGIARGDIIICAPVLAREAREQRKPFLHHAAHLTVHGVLHALGYDHLNRRDALRMEGLEIQALARMGIADPYTIA